MKSLWIAAAILAVILVGGLINNYALHGLTQDLNQTLKQAEEMSRTGDIEGAIAKTEEAQKIWNKSTGYLYIVLRHAETDNVEILFKQTLEYLKEKDSIGEYLASSAALIAQIGLLHEMEALSLKNVL